MTRAPKQKYVTSPFCIVCCITDVRTKTRSIERLDDSFHGYSYGCFCVLKPKPKPLPFIEYQKLRHDSQSSIASLPTLQQADSTRAEPEPSRYRAAQAQKGKCCLGPFEPSYHRYCD